MLPCDLSPISYLYRQAVKSLNGTTLHGSVLRIEISANNKNKLGPRGGYKERKEITHDRRSDRYDRLDVLYLFPLNIFYKVVSIKNIKLLQKLLLIKSNQKSTLCAPFSHCGVC